MQHMTNSQKSVPNTTSNTLPKFKCSIGKRQYTIETTSYGRDDKGNLSITYILYDNKNAIISDVNETIDRAVWQEIQFEMQARDQKDRIF